ncbi:MAG: phytanoyl-CoA dioxygenase family protein [Chloroflexota bacterium]
MDDKHLDYLFDLQGYLVLKQAIKKDDLKEMNQWVDDHWGYVEGSSHPQDPTPNGGWIGNVELHSYNQHDGVNFQNIVEGAPVFERLIDYPSWFPLAQRYINPINGISIHENFLNVRGPGGHLYIHCGGHVPMSYLTFRQHNTGEWMVGQINVLMALEDVGPGDGATALVPGSHKSTEIHPRLEIDGKGQVTAHNDEAAGVSMATQEMHLEAGDVLFFTDAITHGSAERTNPGYRRVAIYRYSPRYLRTRFNYQLSEGLLSRLTPQRKQVMQPIDPRGRELTV